MHDTGSALDALLHRSCLIGPHEMAASPSLVPRLPGVYAWYFSEVPPGVPVEDCHAALGLTLLYVGIAPKETKGASTKPSERTLRCRLRDHFFGNAEGSTLRLTLGCLLAEHLGIQLRRVGSGKRMTFTNPGEQLLDRWMAEHARVAVLPTPTPWLVEKAVLSALALPLNLQGNTHPYGRTLSLIRREARRRAQDQAIIHNSGGPRRALSPAGSETCQT